MSKQVRAMAMAGHDVASIARALRLTPTQVRRVLARSTIKGKPRELLTRKEQRYWMQRIADSVPLHMKSYAYNLLCCMEEDTTSEIEAGAGVDQSRPGAT